MKKHDLKNLLFFRNSNAQPHIKILSKLKNSLINERINLEKQITNIREDNIS